MTRARSIAAAALATLARPLLEHAERIGHPDVARSIRDDVRGARGGVTDFPAARIALQRIDDPAVRAELALLLELAIVAPHDRPAKFTLATRDPLRGHTSYRCREVAAVLDRLAAAHGAELVATVALTRLDPDELAAVLAEFVEGPR